MNATLFDPDPHPDAQDAYRELLQQSWDDSIRIITQRGEVPPWCEADHLLDRDELRIMRLIDESGGYEEGEKVTVEYDDGRVRRVSRLTNDAGFNAEVNCLAVVNRLLDNKYISRRIEGIRSTLLMEENGRWRLDAIEADDYWENADD